ncbi:replication protein A 70 kDa DNA-binding subunit C [Trifolium repens]|nr:replication protein A 70 kDa DNA-binding subunit C [Trifolium repens]
MAKVCKKFDDLADILPNQGSIRIKVRVLRLWKIPSFLNPSEISSIEMVLIDDKGAKIHASIKKQLLYMFDSKIVEGEAYQMSCFAVAPEVGYYRPTLHPYKLLFQIKTRLQSVKNSLITTYGLSLTSLAEVCSHTHDYEFLVDVIGLMTGISAEREYIRDGKITKMVIVELTDASGKCECALFGDYVTELNKKMGKAGEGLPVIVVQFAKIKIFRDEASIQNVINTTRIFINPDIPEAIEFKNSIALRGIDVESVIPVIGGRAKPTMEEEFLRMHPKKKVADLTDLEEEGMFAVYGVVSGIVQGEDWWYPACKCHKAVLPDSGAYYCNGCSRHVFQCIPRFRVKVEVSDGDSTSVFVLFDSDMSYILEKACAHFVGKAKVPNGGSAPPEFDSLIGCKMLFIIDKGFNHSKLLDGTFRVKRVCSDPQIIQRFLAEGPFNTPVKPMSQAIEINSDDDLDDVDIVQDTQPLSFLKDIIVTPPIDAKTSAEEDPLLSSVKRNLVDQFDGVSKVEAKRPIRRVKVKIEKE